MSPRATNSPATPAPLGQLDNRLLTGRARAEILQAIFAGRFEGKLPNEDALARMLNVSRTTVRTALQGLERDGIVTRRRAIGTLINPHVRPSSLALQRLAGFDWLLEERGYDVKVDLAWEWSLPDAEMVRAFPTLDATQECAVIDKAYQADGQLALAIRDAVPRSVIRVDELPREVDPSLFTFSERMWHSPIHHAVVRLVPMVKHSGNSRLELADGTPFLRLDETHYSAQGEPIAYSEIDVDDNYIRLEVVRTQ